MPDNNVMNLKVFLRDGESVDVRRFTVDQEVVTSFIFVKEKLQTVFPSLRNADYKITWQDSEGDDITIASDEDLITAFTEMASDVKILNVYLMKQTEDDFVLGGEMHGATFHGPRVVCDVCNQAITGFRYKCVQCPDYDLCATCEHQGHHSEHIMMRVPNSEYDMPKCARKFVHHFARSLRKSAYVASRDAYRFAKHCAKTNAAPESNAAPKADGGCKRDRAHARGAGTSQQSGAPGGCPFGPGVKITLDDIHSLGAMARQHLGPILEAASNVAQAGGVCGTPSAPQPSGTDTPNQPNPNDSGAILVDLIRNAVDGFFGITSQPEAQQNGEPKPSTSESSSNNANLFTTTTAPSNNQEKVPENATPMDVEPATRENQQVKYPNIPDFNSVRREPGWTFVSPEINEGTANEEPAKKELDPKVAAFSQHPNPKISAGLVQLYEMGFNNENGFLTRLLEQHDGNVAQVVKSIVEGKY